MSGRFIVALGVLVSLAPAAQAGGAPAVGVGSVVYAPWDNGVWYHGKVDKKCDRGLHVVLDDGDESCAAPGELVLDVVPAAGSIRVGTLVIAKWSDDYWAGTVTAVKGTTASIEFIDGDKGEAKVSELRIRPKGSDHPATPAKATGPSLEIWKGGIRWGELTPDGKIWIENGIAGELEGNLKVWKANGLIGEIEPDGKIWFRNTHIGDLEKNGKLWKGGSQVGEIENSGKIWLGGSKWGEVERYGKSWDHMRRVAAIICFFSDDFMH